MGMRSAKRGPVATISKNAGTVKIYHTGGAFTLSYYAGKERKREKRSSLAAAKKRAGEILDDLKSGTAHVRTFTAHEVAVVDAAIESLREVGTPLSIACREYAEAVKILAGRGSVIEAARAFAAERSKSELPPKKFSEVVVEFHERNEKLGRSQRHKDDCRKHLRRVGDSLDNALIGGITQSDITRAIERATTGGARAFNNIRGTVSSLFTFAQRQGYLPRDKKHEAALVEPKDETSGDSIEIYTPAELAEILKNIEERMVPAIVLGAFAGIRTAEIFRMSWEQIRLDAGVITLDKAFTKTKRRRVIPICDALREWLEPRRQEKGRIYPFSKITVFENVLKGAWSRLVDGKGDPIVPKKRNGLRHSYGTYRFALLGDEQKVSAEMGNSPSELREHYAELAVPQDAKKWFELSPRKVKRDH